MFDLGGGTFDVSMLEIFEGVIEVRASTGDSYLGGEDFNEVLIRDMLGKFGGSWGYTLARTEPACCTSCCASRRSGRGGS